MRLGHCGDATGRRVTAPSTQPRNNNSCVGGCGKARTMCALLLHAASNWRAPRKTLTGNRTRSSQQQKHEDRGLRHVAPSQEAQGVAHGGAAQTVAIDNLTMTPIKSGGNCGPVCATLFAFFSRCSLFAPFRSGTAEGVLSRRVRSWQCARRVPHTRRLVRSVKAAVELDDSFF